ncbi:heterokaryon incompatibility protein-domain-containing protein [Xylogone sp. PMI_703]|nr:heterokaryon incompatibility protein-domain-containing protein [Xylogone sp. PMI_703]
MLCDLCNPIFEFPWEVHESDKIYWKEGPHHHTITSLESAAKRCAICAVILRNLSLETKKALRENRSLIFSLDYKWPSPDGSYLNFIYLNREGQRFVAAGFYLTSKWNHIDLNGDRMESCSTGSVRSLQKVSQWINDCENNHNLCKGTKRYIPKRLLEITSRHLQGENIGENDEKLLRLVDSDGLSMTARYITLSYCWGGLELISLKRDTEEFIKKGLRITELPLTFVEASNVAERLKVQYIWIDALCIFQDSRDDWLDQSSQMSSIYENSLCTLAATASCSSQGGLFRHRLPELGEPLVVKPKWPGQYPEALVCLPINRDHAELSANYEHAPLMRRGWAFQERLISRRIIFFCQTQIQFRCQELHQSESSLTVDQGDRLYPDSGDADRWTRGLQPKESGFREADLFELWYHTVSNYSECEFSRNDDKLPALSGLAKKFQDCLGTTGINATYLAGLWSSDLPYGLLWQTSPNESLKNYEPRRAINYRAPSWSWASIDGPVGFWYIYSGNKDRYMIEILSSTTTPEKDPLGPVIAGALILRALVGTLVAELYEPPVQDGGLGKILIGDQGIECELLWDDIPLRRESLHNQDITLMPVLASKLADQDFSVEVFVGFILEKCSEEGSNVYQRLGLYMFPNSNEHPCLRRMFTLEGYKESIITLI